jgi:S1-C subfamily serine protease
VSAPDRTTWGYWLAAVFVALGSSLAVAEALSPDQWEAVLAAEQARIDTIQAVEPTVVAIFGKDQAGGGSGVLIDPAGFALTNFHVVKAAGDSGWAGLSDGKRYRWNLIGIDPGGDLALIRLTGRESFPAAAFGDSDEVRLGQWVMAMGNPFVLSEDNRPTVTLGIVSGVRRYQPGTGPRKTLLVYGNCIQIDSSINPGNSGGPLFDMTGRLIGIVGRGSFEERGRVNVGLGYAISINQCKNFFADLLATKVCEHATLDVTFTTRDGRVICSAIDHGQDPPLAEAGMRLGDRLIRFDGHPIESANQLTNLLSILPAGWQVPVVFESDGQQREVTIELSALDYGLPQPRPDRPADQGFHSQGHTQAEPDQTPADPDPPADSPTDQADNESTPQPQPSDDQPDQQPQQQRRRIIRQIESSPPSTRPGEIADAKTNEEHARWVLRKWLASFQAEPPPTNDPLARTLIEQLRRFGVDALGKVKLQGGDRIDDRRAYRLLVVDQQMQRYRLWLSVFDQPALRFATRLIKVESDGMDATPLPPPAAAELQTTADDDASPAESGDDDASDEPDQSSDAPAASPTDQLPVSGESIEPPDLPTHGDLFAQAIDYAQPRCVKIVGAGIGREHGYATGILISPDGRILTAAGVYLAAENLRVVDAEGRLHSAQVVRRSDALQVALLKIDSPTPAFFELSPEPIAEPADWVVAVANPFKVAGPREPFSANLGVVCLRAELDTRKRLQDFDVEGDVMLVDAITSNPGSPGGALMTVDGRLAGMIGKILESQSTGTRLNYAVPVDLLHRFVRGRPIVTEEQDAVARTDEGSDIAEGEPFVGLRLFRLSGRRAPAYIDRVLPDSPAAAADLRKDDLIMAVDDQVIRNVGHYERIAETFRPGQNLNLIIKRDRQVLQRSVTVEAKPDETP